MPLPPLKPFNQCLSDDLSRVFFNLREFGEIGELGGHMVEMVWEPLDMEMTDITDERTSVDYDGATVYVRRRDVPEHWLPGRQISFLHRLWFVLEVTDREIMRTFKLYRERA